MENTELDYIPTDNQIGRFIKALLIIKTDLLLYEGAQEMVEYISKALKQASHNVTVLRYLCCIVPFLEYLTNQRTSLSILKKKR